MYRTLVYSAELPASGVDLPVPPYGDGGTNGEVATTASTEVPDIEW